MIYGVFVANSIGEIVLQKSLSAEEWDPKTFSNFVRTNQFRVVPCSQKSGVFWFIHVKEQDLYVGVCCSCDKTSPLLIVHKLHHCIKICSDFLGKFTEENVLNHVGLVYDVLVEVMEDCEFKPSTYHTTWGNIPKDTSMLSMLPTNLFGVHSNASYNEYVAESSSSKKSLVESKKLNENNIYVDLIEELKIIINENGAPLMSKITGCMSVKSYVNSRLELGVTFADNLKNNSEEKISTDTVLSYCQFGENIDSKEFPQKIKFFAEQGLNHIFDYCVKDISFTLPITMYNSINVVDKKVINLELKFYCNTENSFAPINYKAALDLPCNTITASGKSSFRGFNFVHDQKNNELIWSADLIASKSHHSVLINLHLNEITDLTFIELNAVNISFEVPSLCLSGIKITSVTILNQSGLVKKWARSLTHTKNYQFLLKHDL